ncbi:MAG: histone deacetylase [Polyangiaceae bacterium]
MPMSTLAVADDPLFVLHHSDGPHPERPERLEAARSGLSRALEHGLSRVDLLVQDASEAQLARVHREDYLLRLGQRAGKWGHLDPDTFHSPDSVAAARRAAGAGIALVDALLDSEVDGGLALVRPPGHHARPQAAMGFCLLNNIAVAAQYARDRGLGRVAVVDFDVHHGNGTQEIFYEDPSVLFVSLHQFPFYPGTGAAEEIGRGDGTGATVNIPLSAGAGDAVYRAAFDRIVSPVIEQFAPELLLVSAGFDAHARDPLAAMQLTEDSYRHMLQALRRVLPAGTQRRIGVLLEGGYDLRALTESVAAMVDGLVGELEDRDPEDEGRRLSAAQEADLERSMRVIRPHFSL